MESKDKNIYKLWKNGLPFVLHSNDFFISSDISCIYKPVFIKPRLLFQSMYHHETGL